MKRRRPEMVPEVAEVLPDLILEFGTITDFLGVLGVDEHRPEHVQLHGSALPSLMLEAVRRDHIRPDRRQVGWSLQGRPHLGDGGV